MVGRDLMVLLKGVLFWMMVVISCFEFGVLGVLGVFILILIILLGMIMEELVGVLVRMMLLGLSVKCWERLVMSCVSGKMSFVVVLFWWRFLFIYVCIWRVVGLIEWVLMSLGLSGV